MKHREIGAQHGVRRFAVVFDRGDDALKSLQQLCERETIIAAKLSGIGGFGKATVAYYDVDTKRYEPIAVDEQVEVLSLLGNVTLYQNAPKIHAHCVLGHRDGRTTGGHLLAGIVRPTLELFIDELGQPLHRSDRADVGIPLIEL